METQKTQNIQIPLAKVAMLAASQHSIQNIERSRSNKNSMALTQDGFVRCWSTAADAGPVSCSCRQHLDRVKIHKLEKRCLQQMDQGKWYIHGEDWSWMLSFYLYQNHIKMNQNPQHRTRKLESLKRWLEWSMGETLDTIGTGRAFLHRLPWAQEAVWDSPEGTASDDKAWALQRAQSKETAYRTGENLC